MKRALRAIVRCFPRSFRVQFGDDMREHIDRDYAAAREAGVASALGFSIATAIDLARTCVAEHGRIPSANDCRYKASTRGKR